MSSVLQGTRRNCKTHVSNPALQDPHEPRSFDNVTHLDSIWRNKMAKPASGGGGGRVRDDGERE